MTVVPAAIAVAAGARNIRIEGVGVEYIGQRARVRALRDVRLEIVRGAFVAIVGRSGSGKSTLLRVIGGLIAPSEGAVRFGTETVVGPPPEVRFVEQDYAQSLLPWLTVEDNVRFGVRHAVQPDPSPSETVDHMLGLVGLHHARHRYPRELSGGMQQRVAIARALASRPNVLLLDEAFSSVDALSRARLQDTILDLWHRLGFTAVIVTHDIDEAVYLADRVVVLNERGAGVDFIVDVGLPRPRDQVETRESSAYLQYRRQLVRHVLKADGAAA